MALFPKKQVATTGEDIIKQGSKLVTTVEEEDYVIVRLNDPMHHNELSKEMANELIDTMKKISANGNIKCVILTANGQIAFCGGVSLGYLKSLTPETAMEYVNLGRHLTDTLEYCRQPVIAAVFGKTVGPGFELALACDFVIAASNTVFHLPEVQLGIIPGWGGTQRLTHIAGSHRAKSIILLGKPLSVETAEKLDIVSNVVNSDDLLNEARKLARDICKNDGHATAMAKASITRGIDVDASTSKSIEDVLFMSCFRGDSARQRLEQAHSAVYKK